MTLTAAETDNEAAMREVFASDPVAFGTYLGMVAQYARHLIAQGDEHWDAVETAFGTVFAPDSIHGRMRTLATCDFERDIVATLIG